LQSYKVANLYFNAYPFHSLRFVHSQHLLLPTLTAKNRASPAVNSRRQSSPSGFLFLPPPLLHSQSARSFHSVHSVISPFPSFHLLPTLQSAVPYNYTASFRSPNALAQGCISCVSARWNQNLSSKYQCCQKYNPSDTLRFKFSIQFLKHCLSQR